MPVALRSIPFPSTFKPVEEESVTRRLPTSDIVPRAVVVPGALSYHLLQPHAAGPADLPLIGEAYRCWGEVWQETFAELENRRDLPSDDFTRQHEVGALFHGYECIALTFYRWIDLSSPISRADSYFSVWPESVRDQASAYGSRVCVGSNFTISAPWRRAAGCSLKDVLMGLVIERFLQSDASALVGTMRADRGMSRLADRLGFRKLQQGVIHHGVDVDLVAFFRDRCTRPVNDEADEAIIQALRPSVEGR